MAQNYPCATRQCYFYCQKLDSDWIAQYYHCKEVINKWNMIISMEIFLALQNLDQDQRANSQLFKWWWEVASKLSRPNPNRYYQCGICMVEFYIQVDRRVSTPPKLVWSFEAGSWILTALVLRNLQWKYWLKKGGFLSQYSIQLGILKFCGYWCKVWELKVCVLGLSVVVG